MKNKKALILAGGLGTRLRPLTFAIPKPLIPVREKPIIDYILNNLIKNGYKDIYVSLNYNANIIKLYLNNKVRERVKINYFEETSPLGTAGPLVLFKNKKIKLRKDESILVINGDILTDFNLKNFLLEHNKSKSDLTVAMINFHQSLSYGILDIDKNNNIIGVKEKPKYQYKASAGIYLIRRRCIDLVPDRFYTMPDLINISRNKKYLVKGVLIDSHWLAIEQIKNLEQISKTKKGDWISKL